jgi:hypothetical protein
MPNEGVTVVTASNAPDFWSGLDNLLRFGLAFLTISYLRHLVIVDFIEHLLQVELLLFALASCVLKSFIRNIILRCRTQRSFVSEDGGASFGCLGPVWVLHCHLDCARGVQWWLIIPVFFNWLLSLEFWVWFFGDFLTHFAVLRPRIGSVRSGSFALVLV